MNVSDECSQFGLFRSVVGTRGHVIATSGAALLWQGSGARSPPALQSHQAMEMNTSQSLMRN